MRRQAWQKAANTDRWTEILFRALSNRVANRWRFVSFRGMGGGEWRGIVDLIGIRKDTAKSAHTLLRSGDLFEIVLIQLKGGSAPKPSPTDIARLRAVAKRYRARSIILFSWQSKRSCSFELLRGTRWTPSSAMELFGDGL
jgi:hypothetical protein